MNKLKNLLPQIPHILAPGNIVDVMSQSPTLSAEKIKYKETYVALVDILGYKAFLATHNDEAPSYLYSILTNIYNWIKSIKQSVKIHVFSDTLIFEGLDDNPINFWNIVSVLLILQFEMLQKGLLIRGGISYGKHFHENGILVSPAIVNAYKLEQRAVYPRIIIDKSARQRAFNQIIENEGKQGIIYEKYFVQCNTKHILEDFDGEHILHFIPPHVELDYLKFNYHPDLKNLNSERIQHCIESGNGILKRIQDALGEAKSRCKEERVLQKINYFTNRWNEYVSDFHHKNNLLIDYTID